MKLKNFLLRFLSYSPKLYWEVISNSFQNESWQKQTHAQHQWFLDQIKKIKPKSVLEVGCGFGRNIDFLLKNKIKTQNFHGVDFSSSMIGLAKKNLPAKIKLEVADATKLPYKNKNFDLVFTHGLLMHISPSRIKNALEELVRVSNKNIIIIEETRNKSEKINNHTWSHDYHEILKTFPVKITASSDKFQDLICLNLTKLPNIDTKVGSNQKN